MKIRNAFSLVELLVVMAIISTLAALLFPSLEEGLEMARRVKCLNNQKQIYVASTLFAQDHDDLVPPGGWCGAPRIPIRYVTPGAQSAGSFSNPWTWARNFYADYLSLPMGTTYANGVTISMAGGATINSLATPMFCPSGHISDIKSAQTISSADYGVPSTRIDYHLAGLAPVAEPWADPAPNKCGYSVFRASRFWGQANDGRGTFPFSYDMGADNYANTPHAGDSTFATDLTGCNLVKTDGSGAWIDRSQMAACSYRNQYVPLAYRIPFYISYNPASGPSFRLWRANPGQHVYEPISFLNRLGMVQFNLTY